jgi:hypothetical protein
MQDQHWPFSKSLEFLHKVKYGGAVGKKAAITNVALIVLAIALVAVWGKVYAVLLIALGVLIVFGGSLKSIDKTLEKHPELALLDGTEMVAMKKLEMAAKNVPILPEAPLILDPEAPEGLIEASASDQGEDQ